MLGGIICAHNAQTPVLRVVQSWSQCRHRLVVMAWEFGEGPPIGRFARRFVLLVSNGTDQGEVAVGHARNLYRETRTGWWF